MITLFWTLLTLIIYCYFGYPLLVFFLGRFKYIPVVKSGIEPAVSIIMSLYNEEDVIASKIKNLHELDYPNEKIEILIGSDGSTDHTHDIIRKFSDPRIKLFINPQRNGKMATLNRLLPRAQNEIIVFTDARQIFDKNAIRNLVANFSDSTIGCVSGELMFTPKEGGTAEGVNLYWNYEKFIRRQEARIHSMLGATGAIYAIRKKLFIEGPLDTVLDDMYIPFKIIQQGYRAIFDDTAHAYDQAANSPKEEYRRKTRTIYGNYQIFSIFPDLFNPFQSPIAWQLFSHKLLRVIIPFFLITIFVLNYILRLMPVFDVLWALQIIFYLMAWGGQMTRDHNKGMFKYISKICYVPYVFCLLNFSAIVGFWLFICARPQAIWKKARDI
ncbi:MAG: glycosyltransferase family 2 protein [Candidatus Omnitrophica bacterium]|nr:glycosyltransferase family 2 protein [Candidatus Omnitrophota bacterium]